MVGSVVRLILPRSFQPHPLILPLCLYACDGAMHVCRWHANNVVCAMRAYVFRVVVVVVVILRLSDRVLLE